MGAVSSPQIRRDTGLPETGNSEQNLCALQGSRDHGPPSTSCGGFAVLHFWVRLMMSRIGGSYHGQLAGTCGPNIAHVGWFGGAGEGGGTRKVREAGTLVHQDGQALSSYQATPFTFAFANGLDSAGIRLKASGTWREDQAFY